MNNYNNWNNNLSGEPDLLAGRGFTSTCSVSPCFGEHSEAKAVGRTNPAVQSDSGKWLPWFNLYNMNGRLYDPVTGRFLSPDNYVQDPFSSQNYNRYSYVLKNPLKYTDPNGEWASGGVADFYESGAHRHSQYRHSDGRGGSFSGGQDGGGSGYGMPGESGNGRGLDGTYYDWQSNTYRSTNPGNYEVGWRYAYNVASFYGKEASALIFSGTRANPGATFRGVHFDDGSTWYVGEGFNASNNQILIKGLSENDFIKYSFKGTNVMSGTIQWGFAAARKIQPTVGTWIKGAKFFGRTTNYLGGVSIAYDFSTGTANTSTLLDGVVLIGSSVTIGALGITAAPWVVAGGVVYGISSIFWEAPLNNTLDISKTINFIEPKEY